MAFCLGLAMVLGPRCVTYLRSPPESDGLVMACLLLESDGLAMATLRETSGPVSILEEKSKGQNVLFARITLMWAKNCLNLLLFCISKKQKKPRAIFCPDYGNLGKKTARGFLCFQQTTGREFNQLLRSGEVHRLFSLWPRRAPIPQEAEGPHAPPKGNMRFVFSKWEGEW